MIEIDRPRLRENVWHIEFDSPECLLITLDGTFEVPTGEAVAFMQVRSHCTGFNSVDRIAEKSGVPADRVAGILSALRRIDMVRPAGGSSEQPSIEDVRRTLVTICHIWSEELKNGHIANELPGSDLPKTVLLGWLVEMYHYIKDFAFAIGHGARCADGRLREVLDRYAAEERGHEEFVVQTLMNIGLSREEIEHSSPMLSTRLIGFLMRELFELEPASAFMMAALVESQDFDSGDIRTFQAGIERQYGLPTDCLTPYFTHQKIDTDLGHSRLLEDNIDLWTQTDPAKLDTIINKLHDLKHAFELQGAEIKSYHTDLQGKYFPRQPVTFSSL